MQSALEGKDRDLASLNIANAGNALAVGSASSAAIGFEQILAAIKKEQLNTAVAAVTLASGRASLIVFLLGCTVAISLSTILKLPFDTAVVVVGV